jgi:NADH dehydrogenase
VLKIDLERKQVITSVETLGYDYLAIALGSITKIPPVQNKAQRVFTLKTLQDAILLKNHLVKVFEEANAQKDPKRVRQLLTFVISGGGYAGVQFTATLADVLRRYFTRYYRSIKSEDIRIILIEEKGRIIHNLDSAHGEYIERHLRDSGVQIMLNSRVTRAANGVLEINGKEMISTSTLVCVTGVQANPRVAEMDVEKDNLGRVRVNDYLQLPKYPGVYVLGDCAFFCPSGLTQPASPRAHNAVRQAKVVAYNIAAELHGSAKRHYKYTDSAEVISLGRSKALLRFHQSWIHGLPAIFFFVISYSLLAVGAKTKLMVILDWLTSRIFGPDIILPE